MTATPTPGAPERKGLRKAGDADVHPSTPQATAEPSFLRKGVNTADSVGSPDRDKLVIASWHFSSAGRRRSAI